MGDMGEYWRDVNAARQEKRAQNRRSSSEWLQREGIPFESKNGGAHLIIRLDDCVIDFWPGTGRWIKRSNRGGHSERPKYGIRSLVKSCRDSER